jgi:hypothetical protein
MVTAERIIEQLSGMTVHDATALLREAMELLQFTEIGRTTGKDRRNPPKSPANGKISRSP